MAVERETSVSALVSGIVGDVQALVRQEIALARTEIRDEVNTAKNAAIAMLVASAVLGVGALLLVVALALVVADLLSWPAWAGFGLVGVVFAVVGGVLFSVAQQRAKQISPVPQQTVETIKENVEWIKERTTSDKA